MTSRFGQKGYPHEIVIKEDTDLNCRCIRVAGYPGRDQSALPADLVWNQGKLGSRGLCSQYIKRLPNS